MDGSETTFCARSPFSAPGGKSRRRDEGLQIAKCKLQIENLQFAFCNLQSLHPLCLLSRTCPGHCARILLKEDSVHGALASYIYLWGPPRRARRQDGAA